jgi:hypothetical protein
MVRAFSRIDSRNKRHAGALGRTIHLRIEELEGRYMLFASPADPPVIQSATPLSAVQTLGMNALPATDVLGTAMTFNNAVPWMASQGSMSTLSQSLGGVTMRTEALGAGQLGSLNGFSRSSHGLPPESIAPQQLEPPKLQDMGVSYELEDAMESVAQATTKHSHHARDAAIVSLATAD